MDVKEVFRGSISGGMCAKVILDFKECGSSIYFPEGDEPYAVITIGCNFDDWSEVFDGILHEMMEFHMMSMELAYQRWYRSGCDTGDVWFRMSHADYSEAISRAAQSIMCFLDEAKTQFDKHQKAEKSKKDKKGPKKPVDKTNPS